MIKVEMTNEDAESFKVFQQHYEVIKRLIDKGIFDLRGTCVEICFNMDGVMTRMRGDLYQRTSEEK